MSMKTTRDYLTFIFTKAFVASAKGMLTEEDVRNIEAVLVENPEVGTLERGTGGVRKMRYALPGGGKSGGARVVYFYVEAKGRIFLLLVFPKNEKASLTDAEKNALKQLAKALAEE